MVHPLKRFTPLALIVFAAGCGEATIDSPVSPTESSNDDVTYDPSTCKTDAEGMVYFALGREVFRRPYQEPMSIRGMSSEEYAALPPRPDPSEPEGCPGNPLWGSNFSLIYQHMPTNAQDYSLNTSFRARSIALIVRAERLKNTSMAFGLQPSLERDFERVRDQYDSCGLLSNGLNVCRIPQPERPQEEWSSMFQADPSLYAVPFGRPFTVSCGNWSFGDTQDCQVSYNYTEDTRISYEFEIHEIPPLEMIEFDKGLRALIESMRVANYRWADE